MDTVRISSRELVCKVSQDTSYPGSVFTRAEEMPFYPGGSRAWESFVNKNKKHGLKGNVLVQFIVGKKGELEDVRVVHTADQAIIDEAVRLVRLSGPWFPAKQNGYCVRSYQKVVVYLD